MAQMAGPRGMGMNMLQTARNRNDIYTFDYNPKAPY
jgi:hypothetical protein